MTYCIGVMLDKGMVFASDSRTHAGVDNFARFCKMTVFERPGDRVLVLLSSGNLAGTQAVIGVLNQRCDAGDAVPNLWNARTMFDVAMLVADAMRAASGADVALTNAGGLRADLPAGPITKGSVYDVIPFDNTIVRVKLTGAGLRRLLEEGLANGRVSQSGLRYRFDLSQPPERRLLAVTLADGAPLDEARVYTVAVNNFMASGGDGYESLVRAEQEDTGRLLRDALEAFLAERTRNGPLDVRLDGRIEGTGTGANARY